MAAASLWGGGVQASEGALVDLTNSSCVLFPPEGDAWFIFSSPSTYTAAALCDAVQSGIRGRRRAREWLLQDPRGRGLLCCVGGAPDAS